VEEDSASLVRKVAEAVVAGNPMETAGAEATVGMAEATSGKEFLDFSSLKKARW
jgi:hypothetical protein